MKNCFKKIDIFGVQPVSRLHFANDDKHQSIIGGCFTIVTIVLFALIFYILADPIFKLKYPKFSTDRKITTFDDSLFLNETDTQLFF